MQQDAAEHCSSADVRGLCELYCERGRERVVPRDVRAVREILRRGLFLLLLERSRVRFERGGLPGLLRRSEQVLRVSVLRRLPVPADCCVERVH